MSKRQQCFYIKIDLSATAGNENASVNSLINLLFN